VPDQSTQKSEEILLIERFADPRALEPPLL